MRILSVKSTGKKKSKPQRELPAIAPSDNLADEPAAAQDPTRPRKSILTINEASLYTVYSAMGERLVHEDEIYTEKHRNTLRAWGDEELFGLSATESDAVEQYRIYLDENQTILGAKRSDLSDRTIATGEILAQSVYRFGEASVYMDGDPRPLSSSDIDTLFGLEPGIYRGAFNPDRGEYELRLLNNFIMDALVHVFEKSGRAFYALLPNAQLDVNIADVGGDERLDRLTKGPVTRPRTQQEIDEVENVFQGARDSLKDTLRGVGRSRALLAAADASKQREVVDDTIGRILADKNLMANYLHDSEHDNYIVDHAYKAAVLSIELATKMRCSKRETAELGQAAMLQDIGMNQLPREVLNKTSPLTNNELNSIRLHPIESSKTVAQSDGVLPIISELVALGHERLDGSGYPKGIKGEQMSKQARILAVANVYAALISPRPYRPALDPYQAMATLLRYAHFQRLDRETIRQLVASLSLFPIGSLVRLESGRIAKVVSANDKSYTRPQVRILIDKEGNKLDKPPLIDLRDKEEKIASPVYMDDYPELELEDGFRY